MTKFMIGSDFHFPGQDQRAVDLWFKVLRYFKPDELDLVGDISDGTSYSRHVTDSSKEFLNLYNFKKNEDKQYDVDAIIDKIYEVEKPARDFIAKNRKYAKKANIHVYEGNHDWTRIDTYFDKHCPEVLDYISALDVYGINDIDAYYHKYSDLPVERYGGLYLHHGDVVAQNAGESVRKLVDKHGVSVAIGHIHRSAIVKKTMQLRDETHIGIELGHFCDTSSPLFDYAPVKNWQQGFCVGHVDENNRLHPQLVTISPEYVCYVDGKRFEA